MCTCRVCSESSCPTNTPGPHDLSAADVETPVHRCTCSGCKNKWPIYSSKDQLLQPGQRLFWSASSRQLPRRYISVVFTLQLTGPQLCLFFLSHVTRVCVCVFKLMWRARSCMDWLFFFSSQFDLDHSVTKSSPEACDLHAICLLNLKFVSVSMTMNKSYVVHLS